MGFQVPGIPVAVPDGFNFLPIQTKPFEFFRQIVGGHDFRDIDMQIPVLVSPMHTGNLDL
jgi:hypothetical protein